ncbi:MAG: TonB-dependent receptor plug domain-containing protein, partial [Sphingobium sp.]
MLGMTVNARCLLGAASLGTIGILTAIAPSPVLAQAARTADITVPAMPMAKALQEIGAQSGVTVTFDPDAVKTLMSHAVRRAGSAQEALQEAIKGTNLAIDRSSDGKFDIINDIIVTARRDEAETNVLVRQASTSDRNGTGLRDQPRNTQVISSKMIEDQQALDIADILRNAGGVSVQSNNPNTGASYTVRGFSAAGLVNGLAGGSQYGVQSGA